MRTRITPEEIVEKNQLYNKYGTFANRCAGDWALRIFVRRYVTLEGTPKIVKYTFKEVVRA